MKKNLKIMTALSIFALFLSYNFAFALSTLKDFIMDIIIGKIIEPLTAIVVALIMFFFFFNSAMYLFKDHKSEEERKKIANAILWSIAILFMLVSVWGIVKLIASTLTLETVI